MVPMPFSCLCPHTPALCMQQGGGMRQPGAPCIGPVPWQLQWWCDQDDDG
eukprot:CAMPEP_0179159232 /NCGR_PEP_ID=MMETSP0796-20121207/77750_1 /TAXON_ID=73915 /ORGANISM="Pyrodinium bahamense, Strain pbaha01" /LENGTH=49 /DNA_ID= /DNA_START= /DNA_END= /DNA_ORIENTATION=